MIDRHGGVGIPTGFSLRGERVRQSMSVVGCSALSLVRLVTQIAWNEFHEPGAPSFGNCREGTRARAATQGKEMRLADFILTNREPILVDWEEFARTCAPASGGMDIAATTI